MRKRQQRCHDRRGTSTLEVLVAFTLLVSVLSVSTPLVVKHGRLLRAERDYRLALDELSNQLERIAALPEGDVAAAVERVSPSEFIAAHLPGVELRGEVDAAEMGRRVTLRLWWDEPQRVQAPVVLAAWILSPHQAASGAQVAEDQP